MTHLGSCRFWRVVTAPRRTEGEMECMLIGFHAVINFGHKQLKRGKDLIWTMVSEVSLHGWLDLLLWALQKSECHGCGCVW